MRKTFVAFAAVLLLSGTTAAVADWAASFKTVDTDKNGQIDRVEWDKNVGKLKLDPAPVFSAMDSNSNNGIDENEWAAAEKITIGYTERCREATSSWCKEAK